MNLDIKRQEVEGKSVVGGRALADLYD